MAGEDEDLELLLSMQDDENDALNETPPSSPPSRIESSPVRAGEKGGFYGKNTESTSEAPAENVAFSRRMAEIRSSSGAKAKKPIPRHISVIKHSSNSRVQRSGSPDTRGYCSDAETPKMTQAISMDAFKEIVKDRLQTETNNQPGANRKPASQQGLSISNIDVEYFSGLKIKDRLLPPAEVYQKLEDLRFVRLPAIKRASLHKIPVDVERRFEELSVAGSRMANECGKFAGSWATVAVLVEKCQPRQSSSGKNFVIWKLGTLDSTTVSLFLFGEAYKVHWKLQPGSIIGCFNANVRADPKTKEPSLSVFHCDQIMMLGTSVHFAICNGIRKDGTRCTMAINKRVHGQYCQYHIGAQHNKYKSNRPELNGGKISIFGLGHERGQVKRKPLDSPEKENILSRPLKIVTTSQLKCMLSEEKLANKNYFQGKRFLGTMADRVVGMKRPTALGEVKLTASKLVKTERSPLVEMRQNANTVNTEPSASVRKEKLKNLSSPSLKTEHGASGSRAKSKTLDVEHVPTNGAGRVNSKVVDEEIEIEWSEGPEDDMVHAWSRLGRSHVLQV